MGETYAPMMGTMSRRHAHICECCRVDHREAPGALRRAYRRAVRSRERAAVRAMVDAAMREDD